MKKITKLINTKNIIINEIYSYLLFIDYKLILIFNLYLIYKINFIIFKIKENLIKKWKKIINYLSENSIKLQWLFSKHKIKILIKK